MIWICFSACTGKYLQGTETVHSPESNQKITRTKDISTQLTRNIATLNQTDTPIVVATETLDVNELIPGFRPEAWTVFPNSTLGIHRSFDANTVLPINDIAEDSDGIMWFATTYGLFSFDGSEWLLVDEYDHIVEPFVEVKEDGSVWFTKSDGVYKYYDGSINSQLYLGAYGGNDIQSMSISDDGEVWIALLDDPRFFFQDEWHYLSEDLPFSKISDLIVDEKGGVYVSWLYSTYYGGIVYYFQGKWEVYDTEYIQANNESDDTPFAATPLMIDDEGHLWFYEWRTGLYEFHNGEFTLRIDHTNERYPYQPSMLAIDDRDNIWLGSGYSGIPLSIYVPGTDQLQSIDGSYEFYIPSEFGPNYPPHRRYQHEGIIPFDRVSALYIDSKDQLWIATDLGIYVLDLESGFPITTSS